jgi:opacity protein-like surface antigen
MRSILAAAALAAVIITPAFAADVKKGNDADPEFMTGVRKLGVMSGEAYACSADADKQGIGEDALALANQIALHFGLQIAFIYSGSFGWGSGHDFDRKTCPESLANFKDLQRKYLNK